MSEALGRVIAALTAHGCHPKQSGSDGWMARCPVHDDSTPSLAVDEADDGRVLLLCRAGCSTDAVRDALGLTWRDFWPQSASPNGSAAGPCRTADSPRLGQSALATPNGVAFVPEGVTAEAWAAVGAIAVGSVWEIPERNGEGEIVGTAVRYADGSKSFRPGGKRGLTLRWPLAAYAGSSADEPVYIVEGASDTAAGLTIGLEAVGRPSATGGAEHLEALLRGRHVCFIAENDKGAGKNGPLKIAGRLLIECSTVRMIAPPAGTKDLRAWVISGATRTDIDAAARSAPNLTPESIGAALAREHARIEWRAVPIEDLGASAPPGWVWNGYLARGHSTILTAVWKSGKSTLVGWLLHDLRRGGGLVEAAEACRVLVITEESAGHWARRRDELGIEGVDIICRPFRTRPSLGEWGVFVRYVAEAVRDVGYSLVVFDTLPAVWSVVNENDASEVLAALMPLHAITEAHAALLLVHHPRKGDGSEGQASRGSGALTGWVDVIVEMRRYAPEDPHDTRRTLRSFSRFDETSPEAVLDLTPEGYRVIGDKATARASDRRDDILKILGEANEALTTDEVHERWPTKPTPGIRTVQLVLNEGADANRWGRQGAGVKGDPYRYRANDRFDSRTAPP